jgi:hypothetical protein
MLTERGERREERDREMRERERDRERRREGGERVRERERERERKRDRDMRILDWKMSYQGKKINIIKKRESKQKIREEKPEELTNWHWT